MGRYVKAGAAEKSTRHRTAVYSLCLPGDSAGGIKYPAGGDLMCDSPLQCIKLAGMPLVT